MSIEIQRKKVELQRVKSARMEMELHIMEKNAEIERLKKEIEKQITREQELNTILEGAK